LKPLFVFVALFVGVDLLNAQEMSVTNEPARSIRPIKVRECIERALANNLDIRLERINPSIASWGVVFQQAVYDPVLAGTVDFENNSQPLDPERATALGIGSIKTETLSIQSGLTGLLPSGAQYGLNLADARVLGTLASNFVHTGSATISLTQPLLKNFGFGVNAAQIRVARATRSVAIQTFLNAVQNTLTAVVNAYYELIFAIEDHKAKLEDLSRAKTLLEENRRRTQIGVMSPLDVTQAEAGAAEREEAVILAEQQIHVNENTLKRLISRDVLEFSAITLQPVDYPQVEIVDTDISHSTQLALERRPDLVGLRRELERRGILVRYNRNQLWPQVDVMGSYGGNARSGDATRDGTFGNFFDNLTSGDNPVWNVGVVVSVPIGNRRARANYNIARLDEDQAVINLKKLEQDILVQVDNAVRQVRTNLKRVDATRVASRLAEESLAAEETKLHAGTSTSFLVLQAQSQLAAARSAEIRALADYSESLAELARVQGSTLRQHNIVLDENF
jgi:outer membrane protein TolC